MWWFSIFYNKIVDGKVQTSHWHPVLDFRGCIFNMPGFDDSEKIRKVESFF